MDGIFSSLVRKSGSAHFQGREKPQCDGHRFSSPGNSFFAGKLEFLNKIGDGDDSSVWTAKYCDCTVAVKALHSLNEPKEEATESRNLEEEITKEDSILEQERSKPIVSLFHYCPEKNWLVMEYCQNGSLESVILSESKRKIVQEWKDRLKWAWQIAKGMNVMHNEPPAVIHRDLNSKRISITSFSDSRITDVQLSKQLPTDEDMKRSDSMNMHCMVWQPPEVMKERRYSTKSDVYSFGVIMHQLLMIDGPYGLELCRKELNARVCARVISGEGLNVPKDRNLIPGKWHPCLDKYIELMNKCCAPEPEDRPEFDEICETLAEVQQEYKKAMTHESLKEQVFIDCFKNVFVVLALVIFALLSVLVLRKHHTHAWRAEATVSDRQSSVLTTICMLLGLSCVFGVTLCGAWQQRRRFFKSSETNAKYPLFFPCVSEEEQKKECSRRGQMLAENSVEVEEFSVRSADRGSGNIAASLPIPDHRTWEKIYTAFTSGLHKTPDTGLQPIFLFCQEHNNATGEMRDWVGFIELMSRECNKILKKYAWRRYKDHLAFANSAAHKVFSAHENESVLDTELGNAWCAELGAGPNFE